MLQTNPPDHTRVRRAAAATFTARRVAAVRDVIAGQARQLIEAMPGGADFLGAFAYPLPIAVICALLGPMDLGGGAHHCLGAPPARLEAQVAFPLLLTMRPGLRLAGPPERRDRLVLRGFAKLPVG